MEKVSLHASPQKGNTRECSNYHTIAFISHASKIILQARLQQYVNQNFHIQKLGLENAVGSEIKLPTFIGPW